MGDLIVLDRETKKKVKEQVYGQAFLESIYGDTFGSRVLGSICLPWMARSSFFSKVNGAFLKSRFSKKKIEPFIKEFEIDPSEFLDSVSSFQSFNDFFIRKLKKEVRPIVSEEKVATLPADGRYLVYPDISKADGFFVKGKKFSMEEFLQSKELGRQYGEGSMLIARLCPIDYHRFHFPFDCTPSDSQLINGFLYSVNPIALRRRIEIFTENKRVITMLHSKRFEEVVFVEVGATNVGSIHQTFTPGESYAKGDEKGYFSIGGSSLVILFKPGVIQFDQDLIDSSIEKIEVRGLMGQSMGHSLIP